MSYEKPTVNKTTVHTEPFFYMPSGEEGNAEGEQGTPMPWTGQGNGARSSTEQREKEAYARGIQEGETRARLEYEKQLATIRSFASSALQDFQAQRENYFARIEPEIVQLSLSIARKILHREAQMDPLLLAGMVHVALEKLDSGTHLRMRAHPNDIHFWNEYFSQVSLIQPQPELIGDPALQHGECALETEIGSTQISLDTQLKEIEQGFFDLLEQRPRSR